MQMLLYNTARGKDWTNHQPNAPIMHPRRSLTCDPAHFLSEGVHDVFLCRSPTFVGCPLQDLGTDRSCEMFKIIDWDELVPDMKTRPS